MKYKIFSGSMLKLLACITMLIDHVSHVLLIHIPVCTEVFFEIKNYHIQFSIYMIGRYIGRIAFPIYAFLLTEGFQHTHNKKKYALNLLLFALISEIPWNLEHTGKIYYENQNVFFTLLLGLLCIICYETYKNHKINLLASLSGLSIIALLAKADYGFRGMAFLFLMYLLRKQKIPQAVIGTSMLSYPVAAGLAFLPIYCYNHKRGFIQGNFAKYCFYAFYPVHMFLLYLMKLKLYGYD
ncbi:MAG: conjugal transfer protein TraX [Oscillospiraceae bacterium]|nr:conjugal transfer protein TraX [Oscillospiraceae bacterium]